MMYFKEIEKGHVIMAIDIKRVTRLLAAGAVVVVLLSGIAAIVFVTALLWPIV